MRTRTLLLRGPAAIGVVLTLAVLLPGCVAGAIVGVIAAAGAAGGLVYENGKLTEVHQASLDRTWNATLATAKQMDLQIESQNRTAQGGTIEAKRADGTPVTITEEAAQKDTRVTVRVGTMGDRQASENIQRGIASHLG